MLVWRCPEAEADGSLGPSHGMGLHEFLHAVLPQDPVVDPWERGGVKLAAGC
jgi:hypothetical protein